VDAKVEAMNEKRVLGWRIRHVIDGAKSFLGYNLYAAKAEVSQRMHVDCAKIGCRPVRVVRRSLLPLKERLRIANARRQAAEGELVRVVEWALREERRAREAEAIANLAMSTGLARCELYRADLLLLNEKNHLLLRRLDALSEERAYGPDALAAAIKSEREACAVACESIHFSHSHERCTAKICATLIRARR
jgi:hypothetical protein